MNVILVATSMKSIASFWALSMEMLKFFRVRKFIWTPRRVADDDDAGTSKQRWSWSGFKESANNIGNDGDAPKSFFRVLIKARSVALISATWLTHDYDIRGRHSLLLSHSTRYLPAISLVITAADHQTSKYSVTGYYTHNTRNTLSCRWP